MKLLKTYLQDFNNRAGSYVFLSTVMGRLFSFLASWIALQLIPNNELGIVLFAYHIIAFILPFAGFGLHQSLLRYGALLENIEQKNNLFFYVLKKGLLISLVMTVFVAAISFLIPFQFPGTAYYVAALSAILIPSFLLEIIKIQFRLQHKNKEFSLVEICFTAILVVSVFVLSTFFSAPGYVAALILAPTLTAVLFLKKLQLHTTLKTPVTGIKIDFWKYGFYAGLTNVVTNFLFIIDLLLVGYLLNDASMVTAYKYVSIIPLSLLFLPRVFIATDYVSFTENIYNKPYIFQYIKSYMLLFTLVSVLLCAFFYFFSTETLQFFDPDFTLYKTSFFILIIGVCGILIFRGLFGNLLSSIGKIEVNYYIITTALVLNSIGNYYLIPKYGIRGAAITSAILMWFTGLLSCGCFLFLYSKMEDR